MALDSATLQIRIATLADVDDLVALHCRVFDSSSHYALLLGKGFMRAAYVWYCNSPKAFALAAEMDGRIVGLCAVNEGSYYAVFRENSWRTAAAFLRRPTLLTHPIVTRRLKTFLRFDWSNNRQCVRHPSSGYLAYLAVDPEARATGAGVLLIQRAAEESRRRRWLEIVTAIHRDNHAVIRLYKLLGFDANPSLSTDDLVGVKLDCSSRKNCQHGSQREAESRVRVGPLEPRHVHDVVQMHLRAFPTFFLSFLGPRFLREFYTAFLADSTAVALVAEDDSSCVCGAVVGMQRPAFFFRRLLRRRWWAFAGASVCSILRDPLIVPRLFRAAWYRGGAPDGGERALLSSIAVDPGRQRGGVGKDLIKRWLLEIRQRGASGCYLTTDAENNASVNTFYLKTGWQLESTYVTKEGRRMNRFIYDFKEP